MYIYIDQRNNKLIECTLFAAQSKDVTIYLNKNFVDDLS